MVNNVNILLNLLKVFAILPFQWGTAGVEREQEQKGEDKNDGN